MLALKVLAKMEFRNRSVYTKVSSQLAKLEAEMTMFVANTWFIAYIPKPDETAIMPG